MFCSRGDVANHPGIVSKATKLDSPRSKRLDIDMVEREGMAQRNELGCSLGRHDSRQSCRFHGVTLSKAIFPNDLHGL